MVEKKQVRGTKKDGQDGYGMVIVVVILFFVCIAIFAALASSMRASRSQENLNIRDDEKWAAKSAMATMRRVLEVKIPQKHEAHLTEAQSCLRSMGNPNSTLPVFDEQDAAPESSVPVLLVQHDGSTACNQPSGFSAALNYTSLLGNTNTWTQNLLPLWERDAYGYGYQAEQLKVARIAEQFRRFNGAGDPVYVLGFVIDARGGQHFRIRENGEVTLGDISQNCGATGKLEITPRTVQLGNPVDFQITYTNVNRLRILSRANNLLHEENVTEQPDPQLFSWSYTPTATDSYRVEALSSDSGCLSRSEWIEVEVTNVTPPACPVIDSLTATPNTVTSGDLSTIAWATHNAAEVTLEGDIVAASGTKDFTILAERTFTLIARDAANTCPATRQVTVRMNLAPCPTPVVSQFVVSPSTATPGQSVTITWQVDNVIPGGTVNITLSDGTILSNVGAAGTRTITAPGTAGTFNYSISAANPCGTSATGSAQLQVNNSCQNPLINVYTATPSVVTAGENQTVRLNWTISGSVDAITIGGIGNVSGNYVDIPQPQVTTDYPITVSGCSTSVNRNTTVTVTPPSSGPTCDFNMESEAICSVLNVSQCGPHTVQGQLTTNGNSFTFSQSHSPFAGFGQGYLDNIAFRVSDVNNRLVSQGAISYTNSGSPYWNQQPAGAGTLYQNSVTITNSLPPGTVLPLKASFTIGYGASAGLDVKNFDTQTSPGGCGASGGGSCNSNQENIYYCDEHTNSEFHADTQTTVNRSAGTTYITVTFPYNYKQGSYHNGSFQVTNSNGVVEQRYFSTDPIHQNHPTIYYLPEGANLELSYPTTGINYSITGGVNFYLDPQGGSCTIAGSQQIQIAFNGNDDCIAGLYKVPEILNDKNYELFPQFLATLMPVKSGCGVF